MFCIVLSLDCTFAPQQSVCYPRFGASVLIAHLIAQAWLLHNLCASSKKYTTAGPLPAISSPCWLHIFHVGCPCPCGFSLSLSFCLSICLSVYLPICLSVCQAFSLNGMSLAVLYLCYIHLQQRLLIERMPADNWPTLATSHEIPQDITGRQAGRWAWPACPAGCLVVVYSSVPSLLACWFSLACLWGMCIKSLINRPWWSDVHI